jgi:hypothetical protein
MWPKVNVRRNVPNVEGARTPPNNLSISPCRSTSMPPISAVTFAGAFAVPGPVNVRRCSSNSCRPARSASVSTGTNPAHDTKFGSSKTAVNSGEIRTREMSLRVGDQEPSASPILLALQGISRS